MISEITPVILAGGAGTRLWPLSRKSYPKQFSNLLGKHSLFQQSTLRMTSSKLIKFNPHIILTNADFRFIVCEQMQRVGLDPGPILIEPEVKNTAPAILAASYYAFQKDHESILLVAPSDHVIHDTNKFHESAKIGLAEVQKRKIVTFGIQPTHPETGYGYIECKGFGIETAVPITRFIEKPSKTEAKEMKPLSRWGVKYSTNSSSANSVYFRSTSSTLVKEVISNIRSLRSSRDSVYRLYQD